MPPPRTHTHTPDTHTVTDTYTHIHLPGLHPLVTPNKSSAECWRPLQAKSTSLSQVLEPGGGWRWETGDLSPRPPPTPPPPPQPAELSWLLLHTASQ